MFWHDKTCDATRMCERDENNEWMFQKTNNKIEENDQKIEKSGRKDKKHDWKKHLNKGSDQTIDDRDFNFFLREINIFSKRRSNRKMKLMTWIKEK